MILESFLAMLAVGFVVFVLGHITGRPDIGLIGGILVMGVAGVALLSGLEVQTGQFIVETQNATTNTTETTVKYTYEDISSITNFPFELIVLLTGSVMAFKSLGEISEI